MSLEEFKKELEKKISRNEKAVDNTNSNLEQERLDRKEFIMHFQKVYRIQVANAFRKVKSELSDRFDMDYDRGAAPSFYDDQVIEGVFKLKPIFGSQVSEVFIICIGDSYNKNLSLISKIKLKTNQPTETGPVGIQGSVDAAGESDFVESVASILSQIAF
jgi:hypothetical protein